VLDCQKIEVFANQNDPLSAAAAFDRASRDCRRLGQAQFAAISPSALKYLALPLMETWLPQASRFVLLEKVDLPATERCETGLRLLESLMRGETQHQSAQRVNRLLRAGRHNRWAQVAEW